MTLHLLSTAPPAAAFAVSGSSGATRLPVTHGATSPSQVARVARTLRTRFLRATGLRVRDLSGIAFALLDNWSRAQGKVELLDAYFDEVGFLDAHGIPRPATRLYFVALNFARVAVVRLAEHLRAESVGPDPLAMLEATGRRIIEQRADANGTAS